MSSDRWKLDKEVARSLEGLKVKAPEAAWGNIEKRLNAQGGKRLIYYLPWAAVIALAFVAGIFLYPDTESVLSDLKSGSEQSVILEDGKQESEKENHLSSASGESVQGEENGVAKRGIDSQDKVARESEKENQLPSAAGESVQVSANGSIDSHGKKKQVAQTADQEKVTSGDRSTLAGRAEDIGYVGAERRGQAVAVLQMQNGLFAAEIPLEERIAVIAEYRPEPGPLVNEVEQTESSRRIYALAGSMAPQYSFRQEIAGSDNAMFNQTGGVDNLQKEQGYLAFSGGMDFAVKKDHWTFSGGVHFSRQGQQIDQVMVSKLVFPNNQSTSIAATSLGNILLNQSRSPISLEDINSINQVDYQFNSVTTEQVDASVTSVFDFVEIPFTVIYQVVEAPLEIKILGGAGLAFLIDDKTEFVYQGNTTVIGGLPNLNTTNYQAMMGLQFAYPIRKSLSFYMQPVYKQSLNSLTKGLVIDYQPYQITFSTGLLLSF